MSASLNEISYRIFNIIHPKLVDDQSIDILEIQYDVENTRAMLIKRRFSNKFRTEIPEAIVQPIKRLEIESVNASNVTSNPDIPSGKVLMRTKLQIPRLLEKTSGLPLIKRISASTMLSANFTVVTPQQAIEYIKFLNTTKHFYHISLDEFLKDESYTFKIATTNSFKTFATLTALRYIEEEINQVKFVLKNINVNIKPIKLLLLAAIYQNNSNHCLNLKPKNINTLIKHKLYRRKYPPDNSVITRTLHSYYSTSDTTWYVDRIAFLKGTKFKPL